MDAPEFDAELWFTTAHCPEHHFLLEHNPFTFPGRMRAWCPAQNAAYNVSKSELVTCSDATRYWVRGYLAGATPEPPRDAEGDWLPSEHPATQRWQAAADLFQKTGVWITAGTPRHCSECGDELLPSQPGFVCGACLAGAEG